MKEASNEQTRKGVKDKTIASRLINRVCQSSVPDAGPACQPRLSSVPAAAPPSAAVLAVVTAAASWITPAWLLNCRCPPNAVVPLTAFLAVAPPANAAASSAVLAAAEPGAVSAAALHPPPRLPLSLPPGLQLLPAPPNFRVGLPEPLLPHLTLPPLLP